MMYEPLEVDMLVQIAVKIVKSHIFFLCCRKMTKYKLVSIWLLILTHVLRQIDQIEINLYLVIIYGSYLL